MFHNAWYINLSNCNKIASIFKLMPLPNQGVSVQTRLRLTSEILAFLKLSIIGFVAFFYRFRLLQVFYIERGVTTLNILLLKKIKLVHNWA